VDHDYQWEIGVADIDEYSLVLPFGPFRMFVRPDSRPIPLTAQMNFRMNFEHSHGIAEPESQRETEAEGNIVFALVARSTRERLVPPKANTVASKMCRQPLSSSLF
jgi:hypothetical protein